MKSEKVLIVGGGAREHALAAATARSEAQVWVAMANRNPGLWRLAGKGERVLAAKDTQVEKVSDWAAAKGLELAIIGPEAGLGAGLADSLAEKEIPAVGPSRAAAQLEVDKRFMRNLLKEHEIPGRLAFRVCETAQQAREFLQELASGGLEGVVKPVGLTGGKGVKVMGDQLADVEEAVDYATQILETQMSGYGQVVMEERAVGQEFTLQGFCDGARVAPMPAAQDHPHAQEGGVGAITGGMGSYSQADGLLPFLRQSDYEEALTCMKATVEAMARVGRPYHGFLYGQFILTVKGPRLVEFNVRFGDPEAMNVLPLLDYELVELGHQIVEGNLPATIPFRPQATVCKYVVPQGYGTSPAPPAPLKVAEAELARTGAQIYYAAVNLTEEGQLLTSTSRACAVVGFGQELASAERVCEAGLRSVKGDHLYVRHDIATPASLAKRVAHMQGLKAGKSQYAETGN